MSGRYAVGVDVGATKILAGLVDCNLGKVLSGVKTPSPTAGADGDALVAAIEHAISRVLVQAPRDLATKVSGIGLGVAGQVDRARGVLHSAPNLCGGVTDVHLVEPLSARFGVPVKLSNDVEAAALGENCFGAGRGVDLFACVFVGTGVGGALVEGGERFKGASGSAGEIGHIMVEAGGRMCGCGQRGHLEAYASRGAITAILREEIQAGAESSLRDLLLDHTQPVRSKPLAQAVDSGDPLVVNTMTRAGFYLGLGLASLINLWNPRRIVLGGGVIDRIDLLFTVAAEEAKQAALSVAGDAVEIVRAELGDNSGVVGAALL